MCVFVGNRPFILSRHFNLELGIINYINNVRALFCATVCQRVCCEKKVFYNNELATVNDLCLLATFP